jgi:hypothetical protein
MTERLALIARNLDDLQTISACLQDALVRVGDIRFYKDLQRFALLVNRFRWEAARTDVDQEVTRAGHDHQFAAAAGHERVHCGVAFDNVREVKMRGIDRAKRSRLLNLLAVQATESGVILVFSGEATIRLDCDPVACQLRDLDEPWPTPWRPEHGSMGML